MVVQERSEQRRTQVERREAAESALLDAAAELFAEQGVTETSMAQIGEKAGFSRGLANHHFGSKSRLIEQLAERVQDDFSESLVIADSSRGLDAIVTIVRAYLSNFETPTPTSAARALLVMWGATFPLQRSVGDFVEADHRSRDVVQMWIERGQVDGSVRSDVDPSAFSVVLLAMLRGVAAQRLTDARAIDVRAVLVECERFVVTGLSPARREEETPC